MTELSSVPLYAQDAVLFAFRSQYHVLWSHPMDGRVREQMEPLLCRESRKKKSKSSLSKGTRMFKFPRGQTRTWETRTRASAAQCTFPSCSTSSSTAQPVHPGDVPFKASWWNCASGNAEALHYCWCLVIPTATDRVRAGVSLIRKTVSCIRLARLAGCTIQRGWVRGESSGVVATVTGLDHVLRTSQSP